MNATRPSPSSAPGLWARIIREMCRPRRRSGSRGCTSLPPDHPIERPDPAIYSQEEQLILGQLPDWDSPDIVTNSWGPFRLNPSAKVVVRNLSAKVSAVNTLVHVDTSPFGIGMPRTRLASKVVNIPRASQVELDFPFDQTTLAGDPRVGIYVSLEHPHDGSQVNNRGEQVHVGAYTSESGRAFAVSIPVLNNTNFTRTITFALTPTDIVATVTPASHTFAPHEQMDITLHISVPPALVGTPSDLIERAVTVVARDTVGELVGGATHLMRIDN